jgi:hypothetical protein
MKPSSLFFLAGLVLVLAADLFAGGMREEFLTPQFRLQSRPLWFWNGPLDTNKTHKILEDCRTAGYCGVGILPSPNMTPEFMSPAYLAHYRDTVEKAAALGMKCCLYDEYWFPSGAAGGLLAKQYPDALGKRLDMQVTNVTGPAAVNLRMTNGVFMGAVAMRPDGSDRRDLSASLREGELVWKASAGEWRVMLFACVTDGARGLVDYLDPEAVQRFVSLTYEQYYITFPEHFGTTIDSAFYDEPTFHWIQGGRAWTPRFNERFQAKHGFSPVLYYPALWFDIGKDTVAARNALFGFRAELYATGFPKVLNDWCAAHKIQLTGHVDQEEIVTPVGLCGDLLKAFQYQDIPAIDQVFQYGRASKAYKLVSSSAYNYDRPRVLTECYGGIDKMPVANLYKEAMDQFAKGINMMVPHAVWYDPAKIVFQPDLSPASARYGQALPEYNQFMGRLQRMLQGGRHVADLAVLYPIATLQGGYFFGPGKPYEGGVIPPEADYMDVGEMLALGVRRDFTFLHPEVLDAKCSVRGGELRLNNKINFEDYQVLIRPGARTIRWSNLQKIKAFYDQGGKVIATTRLPDTSAELGKDAEVREAIKEVFGSGGMAPSAFPQATASTSWAGGGHDPALVVDGDQDTRWNSAAQSGGNQWLEVDFGAAKTFGQILVREVFDRTTAYRIQYWDGSKWQDCAKGDRLGTERTITFAPVTGAKVRLCLDVITGDCVSISEFAVLDKNGQNLAVAAQTKPLMNKNRKGGLACFIPKPTIASLKAALDDVLKIGDVVLEGDLTVKGGNFSYIHKVMEGREVYFFGNSSGTEIATHVRLKGRHALEAWDPHTGQIMPVEMNHLTEAGESITRVRLHLAPVTSVFIVETPAGR